MSSTYLLRQPITDAETNILPSLYTSYFFKSIYISNSHSSAITVTLGITVGKSFLQIGDWIVYNQTIAVGSYLKLDNIMVPQNHQLRAIASVANVVSIVGSGIME